MTKVLLLIVSLSVSGIAQAIETSKCPSGFSVEVQVDSLYKKSRYESVVGWREAREALQDQGVVSEAFSLQAKKAASCTYRGISQGAQAILRTVIYPDPEQGGVEDVQVLLEWKIDDYRFVSYLPVASYDRSGLRAHSTPFRLKVKTRLFDSKANRWVTYDLGMVSVSLK